MADNLNIESPTCPECGADMVLRTAKRGPRRGKQFWGCSEYPECKGTQDMDDSDQTGEEHLSDGLELPRQLTAEPRQEGQRVQFFQVAPLTATILDRLHELEVPLGKVRSFAQWRLDSPPPKNVPASDMLSTIAVVQKLLTRGTTPLSSPHLSQALEEHASPSVGLEDALAATVETPTCPFSPKNFESDEEEFFFERFLEGSETAQGWTVTPQVHLSGLLPPEDEARYQRADFLLSRGDEPPVAVEIDGEQHQGHRDADSRRDHRLRGAGVTVFRIPAAEVREGYGQGLNAALEHLQRVKRSPSTGSSASDLRLLKYAGQVQLALLEALKTGWLDLDESWQVAVAVPPSLVAVEGSRRALELAIRDFQEILGRLLRLHGSEHRVPAANVKFFRSGERLSLDASLVIGPAAVTDSVDERGEGKGWFEISDVSFPFELEAPSTTADPVEIGSPRRDDAMWFLQYVFDKEDFLPGQWETIERALRGKDAVVLLPTGAGKSIAFQLAALLRPGRCIVVDPIIALIEDQIENLRRAGIDRAVGISSGLDWKERERAQNIIKTGHYLFCYVAPERFQIQEFRGALRAMTAHSPVSLIAIDEAHCVSEWGHDFRTAYLNLGRITRDHCQSSGVVPPLLALTGTASKIVLKDVQRELEIQEFEAIITPETFDRRELQFDVFSCDSEEKTEQVEGILARLPTQFGLDRQTFFRPRSDQTHAGLVFCPHVNGQFGVDEVAAQISRSLGVRAEIYSGKPPRRESKHTWSRTKRIIASDFKRDRFPVLVCTKSFGMGIDKPNIRYTIHLGLPASIEAFYQEAGRAGRNRKRARCAIVLSNDDPRRTRKLLSPDTSLDEIAEIVEETDYGDSDDVVRLLWFHVRSFRGLAAEVADVQRMLDELDGIEERRRVSIAYDKPIWNPDGDKYADKKNRAEKALHRLVVIGAVEDYTVDYSSKEFSVQIAGATRDEVATAFGRYVRGYQAKLGAELEDRVRQVDLPHRQYVERVAEELIRFVYEHVELARRRSLSEMLQAATIGVQQGEQLRRRILEYLEHTEWDDRLEAVRESPRGGIDSLMPVLDDITAPNEAAALRGAVGRMLSSYPDVPGLLLLRGAAEALSRDCDSQSVLEDVTAAIRFGTEKYGLEAGDVGAAVGQVVRQIRERGGSVEAVTSALVTSVAVSRDFLRGALSALPADSAGRVASWLVGDLIRRSTHARRAGTQNA